VISSHIHSNDNQRHVPSIRPPNDLNNNQAASPTPPPPPPPSVEATPPAPAPVVVLPPQLPFRIEIKILTFDRLSSFKRCVQSFQDAYYDHDEYNVDLFIIIDHYSNPKFKKSDTHSSADNGNNSTLSDERIKNEKIKIAKHREILEYAYSIDWKFGRKLIHYRQENSHLQQQWIESWYPTDNDTYAYVAEDDIVVSPFWYQYIKKLLLRYRYSFHKELNAYVRLSTPYMYGISLQKQKLVPAKTSKVRTVSANTKGQPYLYQLIGTWGQLLFPEAWIEFRKYYDQFKYLPTDHFKPRISNMITDDWYVGKGEKIWTPWIIRWAMANGMYNMYHNFDRTLSASFRDPGVNYKNSLGPDFKLLTKETDPTFAELIIGKQVLDPLSSVQMYDYCFRRIGLGSIIDTSDPTFRSVGVRSILVASDIQYLYNQLCFCEQQSDSQVVAACKSSIFFFAGKNKQFATLVKSRGFNAIYTPDMGLSGFLLSQDAKSVALYNMDGKLMAPKDMDNTFKSPLGVSKDDSLLLIDPLNVYLQESLANNIDSFAEIAKLVKKFFPEGEPVVPVGLLRDADPNSKDFLIKQYDYGCKAVVCT